MKYHNSPDPFSVLVVVSIISIFIVIPIGSYLSAVSLQKAINTECKGNYSVLDVALNGEQLVKLCQIQNQTLTIK